MARNGDQLKWHIVEELGNIARVINPSYITSSGNVMKDKEGEIRELCAVCRMVTGKEVFGMFDSNGFCTNCGAWKEGSGPYTIDLEKMMEREKEANARGESIFGDSNDMTGENLTGKDGLLRKSHIRDDILFENGVLEGKHYKSLEYREIKEDTEKPEGFETDKKYKYLKLEGFNAETSPLTLEEIQELIDCPYIIIIAG